MDSKTVPIIPTAEMIAAALPTVSEPTLLDKQIGAAACLLLSGGMKVEKEGDAVNAAAQLVRDYRLMIGAAK